MPTLRLITATFVACALAAGAAGCGSSSSNGFGPVPIATADAFTIAGNQTLTETAGTGLLANDIGTGTTVTSFDATSANGGTVAVSSDGSFTYIPPAGSTTTDTFDYTITNTGGSATATVTITVSGMVWWIDNSGSNGDGTQASPFNSIANADAGATDATGDIWYLATGSGAYDGNLTLLDSQQIVGGGAALVVNTDTLETAGTAPTWTATSGDAVTLGSDNTITGVDFGNTPAGFAITDGGSTAGDLQVSDVAITGTGGAISIMNGADATASVVLDGIASTSAPAAAVELDSFIGTFTVSSSTVISAPVGRGVHIANCASGTIGFDTISITGYTTTAMEVDTVAATLTTGTIGLGAHGTPGADSFVVNDCDNVTFGDLTIADADEVAISITTHPAGQTLTFGDVTMTAAADDYGLEILSCAGTIVFGTCDFDGGTVSGNESVLISGLASTGDITFTAMTARAGMNIPSPAGTVDFGTTDCDGPLLIDSPTAATFTFASLDLDSTGHGMRLTNGDGATTVNLTTAAADVTAVGTILEIDNYLGDDGAAGGWMFGTVSGTGTAGMVLTSLANDFTVTTATNFTAMTGTAIAITSAASGVDFTFGGTTTCGAASPNQVDRGVVLTTNNAATTFDFGTLVIDAVTDGFTADAGVLDFSGTAPVITAQDEHAISISSCTTGTGTWTFGNTATTALATSVENVCEFNGCTANIAFSGTLTGTTAAGNGGDVLNVDTHTGNVTTVGLVSASGFTEADAHGVFLNAVNGDVTFGALTFGTFSGSTATAVEVNGHVGGTITFGGAVNITNITGGTNRGIEVSGASTCDLSFEAAITIDTLSGTNSFGMLLNGVTGTIDSTVAGTFQIDDVNDATGISMQMQSITGATNFLGDIAFDGGTLAIQLDSITGGQTINFDGAVDIGGTGFVTGIYVTDCTSADIDFDDLAIVLGSSATVAIDLRGDSNGSNLGASFTIDSSDGTSGIQYTNANATAIFADQLASLQVGGATGNEFLFVDIGTGSTDGGETNIQDGPHAIYARDCQVVTVNYVDMNGIGDTGTDGVECGVYVRNTGSIAPTAITVANSTIAEYVDGHAVFVENTVGSSTPLITWTGNTFGDVTSQNAGCWGYYLSLDGTNTDVSAIVVATANTIQNQGNTTPVNEGGIFLELLNGAGGTTPVTATLGDIGGSGSTITNVTGDMVRFDLTGGADLHCTVENFGLAFTGGNAGELSAVYASIDAGVGEVSDVDLLISNCTISGFDNGTIEPVLCEFTGATTTSDVKFEVSDCAFSSCSAAVAGVHVSTSNDCFDGSVQTGTFDVRVDTNDLSSTGGIETSFTGTDESLLTFGCLTNTNCTAIELDRDSTSGTDLLEVGDVLGTTDGAASNVTIDGILTAGGGNNNAGATVTVNATDTAAVIDDAGISSPSSAP